MTPKDDVFRLIHALSSHEKQVFTKSAIGSRKAPPKYCELFSALSRLKRYDETEFLNSESGSAFRKAFSVKKAELFEKILQVLRSQRQSSGKEKPIEFQLREQVEDARLLKDRKLFDLSYARLAKARKEAEMYQYHEILLEILRLERNVTLEAQGPDYEKAVFLLHDQILEMTKTIHNKYRLLFLRDKLFLPSRQHAVLSNLPDMQSISKVMEEPELNDVSLCLSFEATSNYHFCHAIFQHLQGNAQQAWIHFRTIYLMWQEQKGVQRIKPLEYRNMLQNYLSFSNDALRYEDFEIAMDQLVRGPFRSEEEEALTVQYSLYIDLQKHLNLCNWDKALEIQSRYKEAMEQMSETINPSRMMTFYLSFARLQFVLGRWKESQKWVKKALQEGAGTQKEALVLQAWLLELLCFFELGETIKIEKAKRELLKSLGENESTSLEREIASWIAAHVGKTIRQDVRTKIDTLLAGFDTHRRKPAADRFIKAWLKSKRTGKALQEILSEERDDLLREIEEEKARLNEELQ